MDSHEPYYDDENAAATNGVDDFPSSFSSSADEMDNGPSRRMQPMSVATGEYSNGDGDKSRTTRKAIIASVVAVIFVIVGLFLTEGGRLQNNGNGSTDSGGIFGGHHDSSTTNGPNDAACKDFDQAYFNDLLWRLESMNGTDPALCTTEVKIHDCQCRHPLRPRKNTQHPGWMKVVGMNVELMEQNYSRFPPDVVMYGDSMTEHLIGRKYGHVARDKELQETAQVTQQLMTKRGGGHINALPMGIAADQIANLLYRISSGGEMPESLHPWVWWVLIGTNDIGMGCSIDSVVAGNIRIVKEIRERHNNQHGHKTLTPVVINSLLPRGRQEMFSSQNAWHIIRRVNQQLYCYAETTPGVFFVNVTDTFVLTNRSGTFLNESRYMSDHLHPNAEGNREWELQIVAHSKELMR